MYKHTNFWNFTRGTFKVSKRRTSSSSLEQCPTLPLTAAPWSPLTSLMGQLPSVSCKMMTLPCAWLTTAECLTQKTGRHIELKTWLKIRILSSRKSIEQMMLAKRASNPLLKTVKAAKSSHIWNHQRIHWMSKTTKQCSNSQNIRPLKFTQTNALVAKNWSLIFLKYKKHWKLKA